ncbi:MAG: hypothetical protein AAFR26_03670 [Cyanobacteria bacterium J06626_4]
MTETPDSPITADSSLDEELPIGPGASFTFLYYFSTAAFITALFTARTLGVGIMTPLPVEFAVAGGAIGSALGVIFNRSSTLTIPVTSPKKFRQEVTRVLGEMGYSLQATEGSVSRYQKANASRFFAGDIYVQPRPDTTVFVSRASNIRTLKRRLSP